MSSRVGVVVPCSVFITYGLRRGTLQCIYNLWFKKGYLGVSGVSKGYKLIHGLHKTGECAN